ncbi:MAG: 3-dehydroquinate synthase [Clostridiaceae bacterium]|nr:3-dehydroquinate synthase [Clostridiaceae bacterium]
MEQLNILIEESKKSYPIYFEEDFMRLPIVLKEKKIANKVLIVTDSNISPIYGEQLKELLESCGVETYLFVFKAGEKSKNLDTIESIYEQCLKHRLDRTSTLIALGGGVTGDIAGFAASTFMRGIHFVQVPTSLLAQVDSSVGGKVGVDYCGSKNIIGSFYQPELVYTNVNTLKTLPEREFLAGLAEVIKHGMIFDYDFFVYLEEKAQDILELKADALKYLVKKNCCIKAQVVQQDEKEQGLRAILNFGHTFGHAIESSMNFSLLHGECVAIGMALACKLAYTKKMITYEEFMRLVNLLKLYKLPTEIKGVDPDKIYEEMLRDKKQMNNKLKFILPTGIGKVIQTTDVTKEEIIESFKDG